MKNVLCKIATLAIMVLLVACATQGERKDIVATYPNGEKLTIVAHEQWSPDWLLDGSKLKLNYLVKGDVSEKQLNAVAVTEKACRLYTSTVRPSNLVVVLSNGVIYALAGGIGLKIGSAAFPGVDTNRYFKYGAAASGAAGAANGTISLGGQTYTFENCSKEALDAVSQYGVRVLEKSPF
jgi:hypothetical protein